MAITNQTSLSLQPYASKFFNQNGATNVQGSQTATPRYKFMYYASFTLDQSVLNTISAQDDPLIVKNLNINGWGNTRPRAISFLVKKVDRPKIELTTAESNQYNLRKQNYTRTAFSDITMTLYDTSDNRVLNLWINYFRYYFNNSRAANGSLAGSPYQPTAPQTASNFNTFNSQYGFNPSYGRNFIQSIGLYAIFGGSAQLTTLVNPRITRIDWGAFDSTDSGPTEVTITFKYENIEYSDPVDLAKAGLLDEMGFTPGLEPAGVLAVTDPALSKIPQGAPFDGPIQFPNPNSRAVQPPAQLIYQASPIAQSIYVPFVGAVGGAVSISPVISPFGILVFGL